MALSSFFYCLLLNITTGLRVPLFGGDSGAGTPDQASGCHSLVVTPEPELRIRRSGWFVFYTAYYCV